MAQQILPSVFDRLFHTLPAGGYRNHPRNHNATAQFCESVRRDLERLLNTRSADIPEGLPCVCKSVAAYGVNNVSAYSLATDNSQQRLAQQLMASIVRFEPRLRNVAITLHDNSSLQRLRFRIDASVLINSLPERISFDSALEPATGALSIVRSAS